MKKRSLLFNTTLVLTLLITVSAVVLFSWKRSANDHTPAPEELEEYLFWQAKKLHDFTLTAADNQSLELDDLKGKWSFVFFGYTHCPDVCPMTLGVLGSAFSILKQDPVAYKEIQGVFVSVDPKRDTPELLKEYVSYFGNEFIGVTGSSEQIDAFSRQIGALYAIHDAEEGDDPEDYLVTHNSAIFLIDPRGRLYGRFPPPQDAMNIASTFIKLRTFYQQQEDKRWRLF